MTTNDNTIDLPVQTNVKPPRYWMARLSDDHYRNLALENNLWAMQQRYDIQKNNIVTQLLSLVKEIKVGDVLLLTYPGKTIYAYGSVVKYQVKADHISNLSNVITNREYEYNDGIVAFEDSDVFYEDLRNGVEDWGQRLNVDRWQYYMNDSKVYNYGCGYARKKGNSMQSLFEVSEQYALGKMKELEKQYKEKYMFISNTASLLESKHNIILQGAPGTGKTYNTAAIALSLLKQTDVDLTDHKAVMKRYNELQDNQIFFTTFHQSLDYEDFVEGLKPHVQSDKNGKSVGVVYEPEDGIFKKACTAVLDDSKDIIECIDDYLQSINSYKKRKVIPTITGRSSLYVWWKKNNTTVSTRSTNSSKGDDYSPSPLNIEKVKLQALGKGCENNWQQYAQAFIEAVRTEYMLKAEKPVVLIIDEINRGNVSKVFGELITLLESDKRLGGDHPIRVTLPYSKALFGVPKNLFIIGTMNTTDRSTGSLDYALRRRFAFVTLKSDPSVIESHYDKLGDTDLKNKALALFNDIRNFIKDPNHIGGDLGIDDLMVGHSYFMAKSEPDLKSKMKYEILPLMSEYINDGILRVGEEEKERAFACWGELEPRKANEVAKGANNDN